MHRLWWLADNMSRIKSTAHVDPESCTQTGPAIKRKMANHFHSIAEPSFPRSAIIIVGMHRSGTSAITRALSLLGADLPSNLMPAVEGNNDAGFWESMDIYHLNEEILQNVGSSWFGLNTIEFSNLSPYLQNIFKVKAYDTIKKNYGSSELFLIKDPRICKLLSFWLEVLSDLSINPRCIIPFRHPLEVAASLNRRDGLSIEHSLALWIRHVLDAEKNSRSLARVFCSYNDLMSDWHRLVERIGTQLGIAWPISPDAAAISINEYLQPKYRHFDLSSQRHIEVHATDWSDAVYRILMDLSTCGDNQDARNRLDIIAKEFDTACNFFCHVNTESLSGDIFKSEDDPKLFNPRLQTPIGYASSRGVKISQQSYGHDYNYEMRALKLQLENIKSDLDRALETKNSLLNRLNAIQVSNSWPFCRSILKLEQKIPFVLFVISALMKFAWWTISLRLLRRLTIRRMGKELINSGIFDTNWYILQYPDVVLAGYNPLLHWLNQGWHQGYQPNAAANTTPLLNQFDHPEQLGVRVIISYLKSQNPQSLNITKKIKLMDGIKIRASKIYQLIVMFVRKGVNNFLRFIHSKLGFVRLNTPYANCFNEFIKGMRHINPIAWVRVAVPYEPGLVSIILPSYNGEKMIREALDSILTQTYPHFELIAINDGSSDSTGQILDEYASRDPRITVIHQHNNKLPKTLSIGFRLARGEFLTWTSIDNRLKPRCVEMLVDSLTRNTDWDMVYANMDIIGEGGEPLINSSWYGNYQVPPGSEHIYLPGCTAELNTWANNHIGAAFLYRARVAWTLCDYSPNRFTTEDYDYWMRVNELMTLRHADFSDCIYDYRFHADSLTSQDEDLGITRNRVKLMVFDEFRRSFLLSRSIWILSGDSNTGCMDLLEDIRKILINRQSIVVDFDTIAGFHLPKLWIPLIHVHVISNDSDSYINTKILSENSALHIIVTPDNEISNISTDSSPDSFDLYVTTAPIPQLHLKRIGEDYRGWWSIPDLPDFVALADIKGKEKQLRFIEALIAHGDHERFITLSIIVCTYRRSATLENCLRSLLYQSLDAWDYEIIVVNNEPADQTPALVINRLKSEFDNIILPDIKLVDCPIPGLSYARNAGLSEARGLNLIYIDDDALAAYDCLYFMKMAFDENPDAGIIGGHIILNLPTPRPKLCPIGREALWSQFVTNYQKFTFVDSLADYPYGALWGVRRATLCEMGGFRTNFGRVGDDYNGGEEIVASVLSRSLGYKIGIEPRARVIHDVEESRYSEKHVRKTIMAGAVVNYRLHTELYIPYVLPLAYYWKQFIHSRFIWLKLFLHGILKLRRDEVGLIYASAEAEARARVLKLKIKDILTAMRKPVVCRPELPNDE